MLKFAPYAGILVLSALLYAAGHKIRSLNAEIDKQAAEFNVRTLESVADAERVAREAADSAIRLERIRYEELLRDSEDAAKAAESARLSASQAAGQLQERLNAIYQSNASAAVWRDSVLPDSVIDGLRENEDRLSGSSGAGGSSEIPPDAR